MKIKIEEMTNEELVRLIIEILDSPRAFKLLAKIPIDNFEPHGELRQESKKKK